MHKRKIAVVTGSRAEYGLLQHLMHEIAKDQDLELQVIVTGMHLSPEFGLTYQNIEQDGFSISAKVESLLSSDTDVGITKSLGLGVIGFADAYADLKPELVVLLGDRYEILAAAQAALLARIPIAHLHGGETTEGAYDEAIRHCISKMAYLHFVAAETYRNRVIQLGEQPGKVFNFGALALDNLANLKLLDKAEWGQKLDFSPGPLNFLITYHPVTLGEKSSAESFNELLSALQHFPQAHILFTKANADTDGRIINQLIEQYVAKHPDRMKLYSNLGSLKYLSSIKHVDVVIGNSSSGLIEVPYFLKPTVNIGDRQKGRLKPNTVIDCTDDQNEIIKAIETALKQNPISKEQVNWVYGIPGAVAKKIKQELKQADLGQIRKSFYDLFGNMEQKNA
ncbi:MAG: UDP-N-acetyl-D-glucosamine 2-epimerase, UDP-hydrolyzing [Gammaproteobacteria bacterium]|jgi:UDP-hydrolysing UDP-N-acetyl-D-glucosamine 2-epimerase|nr:UDP-N-acetyl-D-glucosamine 2-epimerase, UDP-hydrolyzing [Gammaproteobacteria bacterium]